MTKRQVFTDKQRLDWLAKNGSGYALISDDNGHWACVCDGWQNVSSGNKRVDVQSTFLVEAALWRGSVRYAIDVAMRAYETPSPGSRSDD